MELRSVQHLASIWVFASISAENVTHTACLNLVSQQMHQHFVVYIYIILYNTCMLYLTHEQQILLNSLGQRQSRSFWRGSHGDHAGQPVSSSCTGHDCTPQRMLQVNAVWPHWYGRRWHLWCFSARAESSQELTPCRRDVFQHKTV